MAISICIFIFPINTSASGDSASFIGEMFFSTTEMSSDLSTSTTVDNYIESIDKEEKLNDFINSNYLNIQNNAALGQGEYLETLYELGDFKEIISKSVFFKKIQTNYDVLFSKKDSNTIFIIKLRKIAS